MLFLMSVKLGGGLEFAAAFTTVEGLTVLVQMVLEELIFVGKLLRTYVTSVIELGLLRPEKIKRYMVLQQWRFFL